MRVTSSSYYNNIYGENNKINQQLFDVNKQNSSGHKIQYSHEDPGVFIDTLRLDDEITTLTQTKKSTDSAYKMSTQTDTTIGDIVKTLESMKVKLINAANDVHSDSSLQAIAKELRGLKNNLLTLSNTSIGGHYLFSGTATSQKPIDESGIYQGNDKNLEAFLGSQIKQKYNISGAQLFLGEESKVNRTITTNVPQLSLTEQYPDIMKDLTQARSSGTPTYISVSSTIRDLMGDIDVDSTNNGVGGNFFYLQGSKSDGTTFKQQIELSSTDSVDTLLQSISKAYDSDQVDVTMNPHGQIEIVDKKTGSSKLDFHMVGAIDFDATNAGDAADINDGAFYPLGLLGNIDNLQSGTTDFETAVTTPGLYIKEFTKSGFAPDNIANIIEGINYDRTKFEQSGATLTSNVSQIVKNDNSFAQPSTKLLDVAGVVVPAPPLLSTLNGQQLIINGTNISGNPFSAQIDLATGGSTFSLDAGTTKYTIFDTNTPRAAVNADTMTYQQLMDVVNMATTNSLPAAPTPAGTANEYDTAITTANGKGSITLDYAGRIVFEDKTNPVTKASLSIYDNSSDTYPASGITSNGSVLTFNANNALTIRDPKTDFFTQIEEVIRSVEEGKKRADGSDTTDPRNIGIQNSIQMMDDLADHVSRLQTESGSYSQVLQASSDRSSLLIVNTQKLQSEVIDTDIAEAALRMQQLSLNYQAMLSTISRVSQLSLVNYL